MREVQKKYESLRSTQNPRFRMNTFGKSFTEKRVRTLKTTKLQTNLQKRKLIRTGL